MARGRGRSPQRPPLRPPGKHPWRKHFTYAGEEVWVLWWCPPSPDESAGVWIDWHDRCADAWYRHGLSNPRVGYDTWLVEEHRRKSKELHADPRSVQARQGYWAI